MNLINEKVEHGKFGLGEIVDINQSKVSVEFSGDYGLKSFIFPDAFEQFLKLNNPKLEKDVMEQVRIKNEKIQSEKERKILEELEIEDMKKNRDNERAKEKLALAKEKRKLAKKPVTKKAATKKKEVDE